MKRIDQVIVRALLTEKTAAQTDGPNAYAFEVGRDATKIEIKQAVERVFGVRVLDVRTLIVRGKLKRFGRHLGKRPNWKKAYVTLQGGDAINVYGAA